jgi:hypothetical protein
MIATLKYGIGQGVRVPVSTDTLANFSESTLQEALRELLRGVSSDPDGAVPAIQKAVDDPRSVIELKTLDGYEPLERQAPLKTLLRGRSDLELLFSLPHAGG